MSAPKAMTMDRVDETKQIIIAQSTSQCCRAGICQPSLNWVIQEADNFDGGNPHNQPSVAWIHEESSWFMRCCLPPCRETKYVQHTSPIPAAVKKEEDYNWCRIQCDKTPKGLTEEDRNKDVLVTHEKPLTCCMNCCCCLPRITTKDANGNVIGKTQFVCDGCCFVPKYDISDANGQKKYRLRPDTCCAGICIQCRCGGGKGKCCRVPYIIRDPTTYEALKGNAGQENAQVTQLWAGWKNECCTKRDVFHVVFPDNATAEEKLVLTGSAILMDVLEVEQQQDGGDS
mmetsp:Transcript_29397/g.50106  ORF Transcript_29397/g.50106 Transcript_29397/m.50106 type:complete len:286 (+) Transcript_29397:60-917(+)